MVSKAHGAGIHNHEFAVQFQSRTNAVAIQLANLLADPERGYALGIAARQRAVKLFSLERMGREYAEAIEACA